MKHLRLFIASWAVVLGLTGLVPAVALADNPQQTVCQTLGSNSDCSKTPDNSVSINSIIKALINILSLVLGVVSVVMIMVSGFKYVTASGDTNKITSAKNTLVYAIIGLVIAALAQTIVRFVLAKLS